MISALFVIRKWKTWCTYFGDGKKTKNVWDSLFKWMQSCQLPLGELNYLLIKAALGLRPDRSKHKLHINFCCVIAKHYIWLCRLKEYPPNANNVLLYLKHIYQLDNNAFTVKKNGALAALYKPFDPSLQNLIKYIYLLYIFFCFVLFWLCPFTQGKKRKRKSREWKRKN